MWKGTVQNAAQLDLGIFEERELGILLNATKADLELLFKNDISKATDVALDALRETALSGMAALLSDSEPDRDSFYAFLLSAVFHSLQRTSLPSLQTQAWRIMPRLLACASFSNYLQHKNLLLLIGMALREEALPGETKRACISTLGRLICSASAQATPTEFSPYEVICLSCDEAIPYAMESGHFQKPYQPASRPLEDFPMDALVALLGLAKSDDTLPGRIGATLSLYRALAHLPLKRYADLSRLIPDLCSLALDSQAEIRRVAR